MSLMYRVVPSASIKLVSRYLPFALPSELAYEFALSALSVYLQLLAIVEKNSDLVFI